MLVALGANLQIVFQVFLPDDLPATVTLHPQPLGTDFLLARGIQLAGFSFEPGHDLVVSTQFPVAPSRPSRRRALSGAFQSPYLPVPQLSDGRSAPSRSHAPFPA